jgi:copper homeostasis protein (lipoprotein)
VEPSAAEVRERDKSQADVHDEVLLDTYWKLVELRGEPVVVGEAQREPHLILHREGTRVSGYGGCNRLAGSYRLAGDRLAFGRLAGTRMACRGGFEDEEEFAAALAASVAWRIEGEHLELFDERGTRVARFAVRHL